MATERQIAANRRNALSSTGPATPEGKAIVRLNAVKHGLRADSLILLPGEDPAEFQTRLDGWNQTHRPATPRAAELVRDAVVLSWRIDRAVRFESAAASQRMLDALLACDCADDDGAALRRAAEQALFDDGPAAERARRYEFALRRCLNKVVSDLEKLGKLEKFEKGSGESDGSGVYVPAVATLIEPFLERVDDLENAENSEYSEAVEAPGSPALTAPLPVPGRIAIGSAVVAPADPIPSIASLSPESSLHPTATVADAEVKVETDVRPVTVSNARESRKDEGIAAPNKANLDSRRNRKGRSKASRPADSRRRAASAGGSFVPKPTARPLDFWKLPDPNVTWLDVSCVRS